MSINRSANGYSLEDDLRQQIAILTQEVCDLKYSRRTAVAVITDIDSDSARLWMSENAHNVILNTARKPEVTSGQEAPQ
jgi:hypothetical protein